MSVRQLSAFLENSTGSLAKVLEVLDNACVSIEYMYAFLGRNSGEAFAVFKMEDLDGAKEVLDKNNIQRLCESEL